MLQANNKDLKESIVAVVVMKQQLEAVRIMRILQNFTAEKQLEICAKAQLLYNSEGGSMLECIIATIQRGNKAVQNMRRGCLQPLFHGITVLGSDGIYHSVEASTSHSGRKRVRNIYGRIITLKVEDRFIAVPSLKHCVVINSKSFTI